MNTNLKVIGLTRLGINSEFTAPQADALTTRPSEQCEEQAGKFTCAVGKGTLAGFPHLDVVNRWLATSKRLRIAH